jgi:quercetin dioxygenase-like cupin family protein
MRITDAPFSILDWSQVEPEEHPGTSGKAVARTRRLGDIRVRMVEYTPGYEADHWCTKGHVVLCVEGELMVLLKDGRKLPLRAGMSFFVADDAEPHGSSTAAGAKLFIVD